MDSKFMKALVVHYHMKECPYDTMKLVFYNCKNSYLL